MKLQLFVTIFTGILSIGSWYYHLSSLPINTFCFGCCTGLLVATLIIKEK